MYNFQLCTNLTDTMLKRKYIWRHANEKIATESFVTTRNPVWQRAGRQRSLPCCRWRPLSYGSNSHVDARHAEPCRAQPAASSVATRETGCVRVRRLDINCTTGCKCNGLPALHILYITRLYFNVLNHSYDAVNYQVMYLINDDEALQSQCKGYINLKPPKHHSIDFHFTPQTRNAHRLEKQWVLILDGASETQIYGLSWHRRMRDASSVPLQ